MATVDRSSMVWRMTTTRTRKTPEQRIAFHEAEAAKLRKSVQEQERALETRRKIILGGALMDLAKHPSGALGSKAKALLDEMVPNLHRPHDRAAFGLEPLPVEKP